MRKSALFSLLSLAVIHIGFSQSVTPLFGIYTKEELDLKTCSFDKEAEAVILLDEAHSDYDGNYRLITNRRVRIKILSTRGLNNANIIIPFYSRDNFEHIQRIEGVTFTENASPELSYLDKKSIFTEKVNDRFSRIKFALPNVKEGSIIEYRYESVMKHYGGLDN